MLLAHELPPSSVETLRLSLAVGQSSAWPTSKNTYEGTSEQQRFAISTECLGGAWIPPHPVSACPARAKGDPARAIRHRLIRTEYRRYDISPIWPSKFLSFVRNTTIRKCSHNQILRSCPLRSHLPSVQPPPLFSYSLLFSFSPVSTRSPLSHFTVKEILF